FTDETLCAHRRNPVGAQTYQLSDLFARGPSPASLTSRGTTPDDRRQCLSDWQSEEEEDHESKAYVDHRYWRYASRRRYRLRNCDRGADQRSSLHRWRQTSDRRSGTAKIAI